MSHDNGYPHEMERLERVSDRDLERLLAGEVPRGDEELEALTSFVRDIKDTYTVSPDETTETRHVAAIVEAAHLLADKGKPVARPASKADGPAQQEPRLPKWRRKPVFGWLESIVARVVVGSVAVVATTGSLAYAGALPEPLQEAAVDVADTVGVTLPDPDEPSDENDEAPADPADDIEAIEPEDAAVLTSDDEDDDPDDEDPADDETNDGDAAGAGAAADNADDSADTETAGGANQAAGADDSDDDSGQGGNGGAASAEDETEPTEDSGQQQQQNDDETEDETEDESEDD